MEHVLGIGGYFMRAADPAALSAWYRDCLGLDADQNGLWRQETGPTVFATFESETGYFGSPGQQTMLNSRVRDLDAMLAQLRARGADVSEDTQDMEGIGRFGWVTDPEGNRVELWQPARLPRAGEDADHWRAQVEGLGPHPREAGAPQQVLDFADGAARPAAARARARTRGS